MNIFDNLEYKDLIQQIIEDIMWTDWETFVSFSLINKKINTICRGLPLIVVKDSYLIKKIGFNQSKFWLYRSILDSNIACSINERIKKINDCAIIGMKTDNQTILSKERSITPFGLDMVKISCAINIDSVANIKNLKTIVVHRQISGDTNKTLDHITNIIIYNNPYLFNYDALNKFTGVKNIVVGRLMDFDRFPPSVENIYFHSKYISSDISKIKFPVGCKVYITSKINLSCKPNCPFYETKDGFYNKFIYMEYKKFKRSVMSVLAASKRPTLHVTDGR